MIQLTDAARNKIQSLVEADIVQDPALRIALADADVEQRGAGRRYAISLIEREDKERTEIAINLEGIRVFLNLDTSNLLSGATVDWQEADGGFQVAVEDRRPASPAERTPTGAGGSTELGDRVQAVLDESVNPRIAAHGGSVELVDVEDGTIFVRMNGGCQGCAASAATLRQGVERMIREEVPEVTEVVDLTDHNAGATPYY